MAPEAEASASTWYSVVAIPSRTRYAWPISVARMSVHATVMAMKAAKLSIEMAEAMVVEAPWASTWNHSTMAAISAATPVARVRLVATSRLSPPRTTEAARSTMTAPPSRMSSGMIAR